MSTSKLFNKVDSSDYITAKKQMTIAREFVKANTATTFNPIKHNGLKYNKNYKFIPTTNAITTDASNCLIQAKSFDLLQDYNVGAGYVKQQCM
jgi:hypothetical protein